MPMVFNQLDDFHHGPTIIEGTIHKDSRGEFRTLFCSALSEEAFPEIPVFSQTNLIQGTFGALRGFHVGTLASNHWKIVSCIQGKVLEAFLDFRFGSPTFGQVRTLLASEERNESIIIPPGFGHAMQTQSPSSFSVYSTNVEFQYQDEIDINPVSEEILIQWKTPYVISDRDATSKTLREFINKEGS